MAEYQTQIEQIITDAITVLGYKVFDTSQKYVPVVTGKLQRSGNIATQANGFEIEYTAPYAQDVEFGRNQPRDPSLDPEPVVQPSPETTIWSKGHKRTIKRGKNRGQKYTVKGHTKTFKNYNIPIQVGEDEYRTINSTYKTQGRHYLGNALEDVFKDALTIQDGLEGSIKVSKIIA